jgi:hypothetical protein
MITILTQIGNSITETIGGSGILGLTDTPRLTIIGIALLMFLVALRLDRKLNHKEDLKEQE